jgi:hypothetical protein
MLAALGCSTAPACPGGATPVTVTVEEVGTNLFVCNAQVTATNGSATYDGMEQSASDAALSDASCAYALYPSASGTYSIMASAPGLHATQPAPQVTLQFDSCGYEGAPHDVIVLLGP